MGDTGDFTYEDITYKLYYVIDKTTAKYTDGKVYGIRANAFGEITPETDLIQTEIAVKGSTPEEITEYALNTKDFIYSNANPFIMGDTGDFTYEDITYKLYYVIDKTTAKYTDGKVYGIRANAFGEITPETDLIQTEIAVKGSTPEEKAEYVSSIRLKNFIHTDLTSFTIEDNGDFTYEDITYKLYYVIDNNTAKYTDGSIFGVRGERFGTIDATSSEIIEAMFITENQHKIDRYVNTINNKSLESVKNGSEFKLTADGSFTFDGVNYVVDSIIDGNSAQYTKPLLLLFKQTITFSLIGEFFGRVETATIVEKVASTYDYRIMQLVDEVNGSSLVNTTTLTLFTLLENGDFIYNGQTFTVDSVVDNGIVYNDGKTYLLKSNEFGYMQNTEFIPIAIYMDQKQLAFIQNINNAQLTLAFKPDSIFTLPLSGYFKSDEDELTLEEVINSTTARYKLRVNSYTDTIILGLRSNKFGRVSSADSPDIMTGKIYAVQKTPRSEIEIFNQLLASKNMINYDGEAFTLEQLEPESTILHVDTASGYVYTAYPESATVSEFYISSKNQFVRNGATVIATEASSAEASAKYINTVNNYRRGNDNNVLLVSLEKNVFQLDQKANFIYQGIQHNYFYNINEFQSMYTYTKDGRFYIQKVGLKEIRFNGAKSFGYMTYQGIIDEDNEIASVNNTLSGDNYLKILRDSLLTTPNGQQLNISGSGGFGDFTVNGLKYNLESINNGSLVARYSIKVGYNTTYFYIALTDIVSTDDQKLIGRKLIRRAAGEYETATLAINLIDNEENRLAIAPIHEYNLLNPKTAEKLEIDSYGIFYFDNKRYTLFTPIDDTTFRYFASDGYAKTVGFRNDGDSIEFGNISSSSDKVVIPYGVQLLPAGKTKYKNFINNKKFEDASGNTIVLPDSVQFTNNSSIYKPVQLLNSSTMNYVEFLGNQSRERTITVDGNFYGIYSSHYMSNILGFKPATPDKRNFINEINAENLLDVHKNKISIDYNSGLLTIPYSATSSDMYKYYFVREINSSQAIYIKQDKKLNIFSLVSLSYEQADTYGRYGLKEKTYNENNPGGSTQKDQWIGMSYTSEVPPLIENINNGSGYASETELRIRADDDGSFMANNIKFTYVSGRFYTTNNSPNIIEIVTYADESLYFLGMKSSATGTIENLAIVRSTSVDAYLNRTVGFYYRDGTLFTIAPNGTFNYDGDTFFAVSFRINLLDREKDRMEFRNKSRTRVLYAEKPNGNFTYMDSNLAYAGIIASITWKPGYSD